MAQRLQAKGKVSFTITPEQAASKAWKPFWFHKKFSTLLENEHLKERLNNMDRRLQQLLTEKQQNLQRESGHKENEDLKLQVKFLVDKNKSLREETKKLQKDKEAAVEKTEKLEKLLFEQSHKNQEIVKSLESAHELIDIREKELDRITGINEDLSETLFKTEELLLEAGNKIEEKEKENQEIATSLKSAQEVIAIKDEEVQRITIINENLSETLSKTEKLLLESSNEVKEKEKENQVIVKSAEELLASRDQEIQQIANIYGNLSEMLGKTEGLLVETELWIQKKNKKSFCKFFKRTKDRQNNQKKTEEVIEEREEPQEQEKNAKKKSFWSRFKSNKKVEEAAGSST